MAIRLWPQDYEQKEHISKGERMLLRNAERNFTNGHFVVGINPVGMSTDEVRMGFYLSPLEGLISFSIKSGFCDGKAVDAYKAYIEMVENAIYEHLLNSKLLIVRNGEYKTLKMPYKHVMIFPDEKYNSVKLDIEQKKRLLAYALWGFFRPATSTGSEKMISDLNIFSGCRKKYDFSFRGLSDLECRAVFERLAPEYIVLMNEKENVEIKTKYNAISEEDLKITGEEIEYKTFYLDKYQVAQVNDMGKGHRVILANPGAGKSVLLLSKAFKYASIYKLSNVLLTCYNNNLADSYNFKRSCANFGEQNNLYIMTFHKLVKKIYEDCLHSKCSSFATTEEIQKCIDLVKAGAVKLRFQAIFIDEVQIFDPLYLELCYLLLEKNDDSTFLLAGDLNQAVRALSRKGDAPWKRINGVKLDFTGRVKYIDKNYRNGREIAEYIKSMLTLMNKRLTMLDLINSMEYEYNSFTVGEKPAIALKVNIGINRMSIQREVLKAVKEISEQYQISYSDIAILFPYKQHATVKYNFVYWVQQALDGEGISYSMIISSQDGSFNKTKYSQTTGIILSTIDSSLGLDFKAVILAGLYPYNYVFGDGYTKKISSWDSIKKMNEEQQSKVQSQMRAMYTACSRAREVLYVLSDLTPNSPMEEILKKY